jgi:hypothetical protein
MIGPAHFVTTTCFEIETGEDEKTSPGRFGKSFSNWVADRLRERGEAVGEVLPEDFGWVVTLVNQPVRFWIGCGNREGSATEWGAYVVAEPGFLQRLLKRQDVRSEVERLSIVLQSILAAVPGGSAHCVE